MLYEPLEPNIPYRTHKAEYGYTPTFVERQNVTGNYGDNEQDFYLTVIQKNWSGGAGKKFFRTNDPEASNMYYSAGTMDPSTPGQLTVGHDANTFSSGTSLTLTAGCPTGSGSSSGVFAACTSTTLYEITDTSVDTSKGAHGLGAAPSKYGMCTDGTSVYLTTETAGTVGVRRWSGSAFSTFSATAATSIEFLNNQLYGIRASDMKLNSYDSAGTATLVFQWKDAIAGRSHGVEMKRLVIIACALLFVPSLALAEPKTADEWYKQGETEYNLGNFEKAADAFKQGFSLETVDTKKPAYLFNVAQAYRQANRCKDAVFFYNRFISLKDQDTVKPLAAKTELEECAKNQDAIRAKPPDDTMHPDSTGSGSAAGSGSAVTKGSGAGSATRVATTAKDPDAERTPHDDGEDGGDVTTRVIADHPKVLTARFVVGGAKLSAGGLAVPIQPSFTLTAGYPIPVKSPRTNLDGGLVLAITPIAFTNSITNQKKTASMVEALANIGLARDVAPKFSVRGDVGVGVLFFGGIQEMGNPFTAAGAGTTGTLAMFAMRVAVSADYKLTPNLFATATPFAFSYSPAKSGMREDIKAFTRIDFMLGIGYRM